VGGPATFASLTTKSSLSCESVQRVPASYSRRFTDSSNTKPKGVLRSRIGIQKFFDGLSCRAKSRHLSNSSKNDKDVKSRDFSTALRFARNDKTASSGRAHVHPGRREYGD